MPDDPAIFEKARSLILKDDYKGARKLLDIILGDGKAGPRVSAEANILMAEVLAAFADLKGSLEHAGRAEGMAAELGDDRLMAMVHYQFGHAFHRTADFEKAKDHYDRGLDLARKLKDRGLEGLMQIGLGNLLYVGKNYYEAEARLREAVLLIQDTDQKRHVARVYNNLGTMVNARGERGKALELFDRSIQIAKKAGTVRIGALATMNRAGILLGMDRVEEAKVSGREAMRLFQELSDKALLVQTYILFGEIHRNLKEWDEAEDYLQKAVLLTKSFGDPTARGKVHLELGKMLVEKGERERGLRNLNEARSLFEGCGDRNGLADVERVLKGMQGPL